MGREPKVELHDAGLVRRMLLTFVLLGLVYAGLVVGLTLAGLSVVLVAGIAAVVVAVQLLTGDRLMLNAIGAREAFPHRYAGLHAAVDRVCMQADMRKPRVAISSSGMPNALAVGRTRGGATVCVTERLLDLLDPAELEAVLAHELAHIQHRDALVMTVASFFSLVAGLLVRFGAQFGHAFVKVAALAVGLVAWAASVLLLRALSRYRELSADRAAALITGRPSALASALMKLDGAASQIPRKDLRKVQPVSALCIVPAGIRGRFDRIFATHPHVDRRIAALHALERDLQRPLSRAA
jgi:heat shock protein HtpX